MHAIRHLWAHHRAVLVLFLGAALITLFFLVRLTVFSLYWADPTHRNLAPEAWMTPGYVAHSWGLDPDQVSQALGSAPGRRRTLEDIARAQGVPVDRLLDRLSAYLAAEAEK